MEDSALEAGQVHQVQVGRRRASRMLVLQERHLPQYGRMPRRGARTGDVAHLQELPVVLPQVLQEGQGCAGQDAARTCAPPGPSQAKAQMS